MRNYIRHPTSIPIHVCAGEHNSGGVKIQNLSVCGLCFITNEPVKVGAYIEFLIQVVKPDYQGNGVVVWRRKKSPNEFEVGLRFTTSDEYFRVRMVEQVCKIEEYRQIVLHKGRQLSSEEAALEWIDKYAKDFDHEEE